MFSPNNVIHVLTLGYCFNKLQIFSDFAEAEASQSRGSRQSTQCANARQLRSSGQEKNGCLTYSYS